MNRVHTMPFRLLVASFLFCLCFATRIQAQTPSASPSPSQESGKPAETKPTKQEGEENPFAPEPAAPLPAGQICRCAPLMSKGTSKLNTNSANQAQRDW